jgi:2-keto-4-pentenoate hydratase/2-oxohepta-3-ene-1,7-dioic acid hydratase in catechol pathway
MKLLSFEVNGRSSFGVLAGNGIVDLGRRFDDPDLKSFIGGGVDRGAPFVHDEADFALDDVDLLPPIPNPQLILATGLNTHSHREEMARIGGAPKLEPYPRIFMRNPDAQVGHRAEIWLPKLSEELDYEGEIALIVGRGGRYIPAEKWTSHVVGMSCFNDGSVRDFQVHTQNSTVAGKNFVRSGGFGPWITTLDEIGDPAAIELTTRVNREVRQRMTPGDLLFGFGELIAYFSQIFLLHPGDVILTGSPAGVGHSTRTWLKVGDVVEVSISRVGSLINQIVDEPT